LGGKEGERRRKDEENEEKAANYIIKDREKSEKCEKDK
jgi:hypothetical protein